MGRPLGFIIISLLFLSCNSDDAPTQPVTADFAGYWQLDKTLKDGVSVGFDKIPSSLATNLQNQYFFLDGTTNQFELILEVSISVVFYAGQWDINAGTFTTKYKSGGSSIYNVKSFSKNEFILIDQTNREYDLIFKRIEKDNYPETILSSTINGQAYIAVSNQAYSRNGIIELTGENSVGDWIAIFINNPENLVAKQVYPIGTSGVYRSSLSADSFTSIQGQFEIKKITSSYISISFLFDCKNQSGAQVSITNGIFKAIVKKD